MADQPEAEVVSDFMHAWMRRMEQKFDRNDDKLDQVLKILVRRETRIGRVERDVGEIKLDLTGLDRRLVTLTTSVLRLADSLDAVDLKFEALNTRIGKMDAKIDRLGERVANIDGKLDISTTFEPN